MKYDADTTLTGDIIFNGIKFPVSTTVGTLLEWTPTGSDTSGTSSRSPVWYVGVLLEAKFTDINFELNSPIAPSSSGRAPIPAIGVVGRGWVTSYVSITGEFSAFKLPDEIDTDYGGHYYEWDIYGTVNFTRYLGAQVGWRSHDLAYVAKNDRGDARPEGFYFGGVVRF